MRLALAHLADPTTFINLYLPAWKNILWTRDIDVSADDSLLSALSDKSGIEHEELFRHTLRAYEGYLAETINPNVRNPFIQSLGSRGRIKTGYGIRFCPICLREDQHPYFRRRWRLSFSTACISHKCFLIDRCPNCGSPITLYRSLWGKEFPVCMRCHLDFRAAKPESIEVASYGLEAIRMLYEILQTGIFCFGERYAYSFLFFRVLRQYIRITKFQCYTRGLLDHEVVAQRIALKAEKRRQNLIEDIPLTKQYLLFSGLMKLFESFPCRVVEFCKLHGLRRTDLTRDVRYIPFFHLEIANMFSGESHPISLEEVNSATEYVLRQRGTVCREWVAKLMGVYLGPDKAEGLFSNLYQSS